jgi:hypothetical protein
MKAPGFIAGSSLHVNAYESRSSIFELGFFPPRVFPPSSFSFAEVDGSWGLAAVHLKDLIDDNFCYVPDDYSLTFCTLPRLVLAIDFATWLALK